MDLTPLYPWLNTGHILLAIVAVGFNLTYGILIRRAAAEPEHFGHVLRTVKVLDDRFRRLPICSCRSWGWRWCSSVAGPRDALDRDRTGALRCDRCRGRGPLLPDAAKSDRGRRSAWAGLGRVPPAHCEGQPPWRAARAARGRNRRRYGFEAESVGVTSLATAQVFEAASLEAGLASNRTPSQR